MDTEKKVVIRGNELTGGRNVGNDWPQAVKNTAKTKMRRITVEEEREDTSIQLGNHKVSSKDVRSRVKQLFFAGRAKEIWKQPVVSARLFACVSLLMESSSTGVISQGRRLRSQPASQLGALFPLLNALVQAELTSLGKPDEEYGKKVLHFCSFDYSSTMPPVDRTLGSNSHLEENIASLHAVLKEMNILCTSDLEVGTYDKSETGDDKIRYLSTFISILRCVESESNNHVRNECSKVSNNEALILSVRFQLLSMHIPVYNLLVTGPTHVTIVYGINYSV